MYYHRLSTRKYKHRSYIHYIIMCECVIKLDSNSTDDIMNIVHKS